MRSLAAVIALGMTLPALAQDEQPATPPPITPRAARAASPATTAPPVDEARLAELVDQAVDRAVARHLAARAAPPPPALAYPSAQATAQAPARVRTEIVPAAPRRAVGSVPAIAEERQYVRVEVPRGPCKRCMAAIGERLVEAGRPRTRLMRVAPAELVTCTTTAAARPVMASHQSE